MPKYTVLFAPLYEDNEYGELESEQETTHREILTKIGFDRPKLNFVDKSNKDGVLISYGIKITYRKQFLLNPDIPDSGLLERNVINNRYRD